MRNKMLRSVLVAAFSAVVALGGLSGAKGDVRADSHWPAAAADIQTIQTVSTADDGSGS
ncbi:hypothetical protein ACWDBO_17315 [Streptomyces mirabilis]|uniref:hypothetical protein n=1 Tax=Streptomyces mirabilis TaxID=68239 RepID=UPI0033223C9D